MINDLIIRILQQIEKNIIILQEIADIEINEQKLDKSIYQINKIEELEFYKTIILQNLIDQ